MCRNIRVLYNFDPPTGSDEVHEAALQYVRKVSGVQSISPQTQKAFELAVRKVTNATADLLAGLPPRKQPPPTLPPLRRLASKSAASLG